MAYTFEVCAPNLQSALAAKAAGANRIELCSALELGGLTPSLGLVAYIVEQVGIPAHVLLRPRDGNFCYDRQEWAVLERDLAYCREVGAAGVVIGALTADNQLDLPLLAALRAAAGPMEVTCHRAFDFVADPFEAMQQLIDLGFDRILSSGQAATAFEGRLLLRQLVEKADGRIAIMPGSGIEVGNIQSIAETTGAKDFHFSAKTKILQPAGILPGLNNTYIAADLAKISEIMSALQ